MNKRLKHIKSKVLSWLKGFDFYYKIRFTKPIVALVYMINPQLKKMIEPENEFYRKLLMLLNSRDQILVFDIGASIGQLTEVFLNEKCKVVAIEPHPSNCRILNLRFGKNNNLSIIPKAVSSHQALTTLYAERNGTSLHTLEDNRQLQLKKMGKDLIQIPIESISLAQLIDKFGRPALIKIDVEGHEKSVIKSLKHPIPIITFECNLPEYREDAQYIIGYLSALNDDTVYNFFDGSKEIFDSYITQQEALHFIESTKATYFDVICINPNFIKINFF